MLTLTACGASTTSEENFNKFSKNLKNFCSGEQFGSLQNVTNQKEFNEATGKASKAIDKSIEDIKGSEVGGNLDKFKDSFVKYIEESADVIDDGYKAAENSFDDSKKMEEIGQKIQKDTKKIADEFNKIKFKEDDQIKEVIKITKGC